jgi:hypothetical protein
MIPVTTLATDVTASDLLAEFELDVTVTTDAAGEPARSGEVPP